MSNKVLFYYFNSFAKFTGNLIILKGLSSRNKTTQLKLSKQIKIYKKKTDIININDPWSLTLTVKQKECLILMAQLLYHRCRLQLTETENHSIALVVWADQLCTLIKF